MIFGLAPLFGRNIRPRGQAVLTSSTSWTVPAGVKSVSIACIGAGGSWGSSGDGGGGGGAWSSTNDISVTPGESLTFESGSLFRVLRGGDVLVAAESGRANDGTPEGTGQGGAASNGVGDVRRSGGNGGTGGRGGGGGAASYFGDGGDGGNDGDNPGQAGNMSAGGGATRSGFISGGGGGVDAKLLDTPNGRGGIVNSGTAKDRGGGGFGGGENGAQEGATGSTSSGGNYGGGQGSNGSQEPGMGAARIIWGEGRKYPDNSGDV